MASCDWAKIKGGTEAKAMFRHCEADERLKANHTNTDIDKSRTHLNMNFGAFEQGYADICKAYDDYIEALDSVPGANKRKDRVTCIGWSIPAPEGLSDSDTQDWFIHAYGVLHDLYGDTVLGGTVHMDEVHEYTDPETHEKRMSRPAMHVYAVPEVGGKLNAKAFCSRANMVATNNAIEAMTNARYPGMKWQTGTKKKSRKTVEELKQASDAAAVIADAQEQAAQLVAEAQVRADDLDAQAAERIYEAHNYAKRVKREASEERERSHELANAVLSDADEQAREITEKAVKTSLRASQTLREAQKLYGELSQAHEGLPEDAPEIAFMKRFKMRRPDGVVESVYDTYQREARKEAERKEQLRRERKAKLDNLLEMGEEMERQLQSKYNGQDTEFDF